jgi:hypothetical protein
MPTDWTAMLRAIDGSTSADVEPQLRNLPPDATHLILSVGGNDALMREDVLRAAVRTSAEAFLLLAGAVDDFERSYRAAIRAGGLRASPLSCAPSPTATSRRPSTNDASAWRSQRTTT